jgi:hypothetical protein
MSLLTAELIAHALVCFALTQRVCSAMQAEAQEAQEAPTLSAPNWALVNLLVAVAARQVGWAGGGTTGWGGGTSREAVKAAGGSTSGWGRRYTRCVSGGSGRR